MTSHKIIIFFTVIGLSVGDLVPLLVPTGDNQQSPIFGVSPTITPSIGVAHGRNTSIGLGRTITPLNGVARKRTPSIGVVRARTSSIGVARAITPSIGRYRGRNLRLQKQFKAHNSTLHNSVIKQRTSPLHRSRKLRPGIASIHRTTTRGRILTNQGPAHVNSGLKIEHQQENLKNNIHHVGNHHKGPLNHGHEYIVEDQASGNHYSHSERRNGNQVTGTYYVHLPDGRKQTVTYYADETGYHPTVTYEQANKYTSTNKAQRVPQRPRPASRDPHQSSGQIGVGNTGHHSSVAAHHQANQDSSTFVFPQDSSLSNYDPVAILRAHQGSNQQFSVNTHQPSTVSHDNTNINSDFNQDSYQGTAY